jgi:uncharacterized protein (DUF1330 family)
VPVIDPTPEQVAQLTQLPDDGPIVMINLLAFKQSDGVRSYERYGELVQPFVEKAGGKILHFGAARQLVIGEGGRAWWDAIGIVEYPSVAAFLAMVTNPDYQAIHVHRAEGLERAELIATAPGTLT